MSKLVAYTIELFRPDKRIKRNINRGQHQPGLRLVDVLDYPLCTKEYIDSIAKGFREAGFLPNVIETYVEKTNMMTGAEFKERYDTPYYCSPSSETYYSM